MEGIVKVAEYRDEVLQILTKVDTRQEEIFHRVGRIEKHLDRLNGKVAENEKALIVVKTWGMVALVTVPLLVNVVMRIIL
jgi:hypothetical protein|tara:strand:- start:623 stop:862 length:240 start_codon:yes stop_codon:yes gene_type:complete